MIYAALAILGFVAGLTVRLATLLFILALLLLLSVVFALGSGFSFLDTALTVMGVQTIVQVCYFLGLVAKTTIGTNRVHNL